MTKCEAEIIIKIFSTVDGGCHYCASDAVEKFVLYWPEYIDLAAEVLGNTPHMGYDEGMKWGINKTDCGELGNALDGWQKGRKKN